MFCSNERDIQTIEIEQETLNTLKYAARARNIRNAPRANHDPRAAQLAVRDLLRECARAMLRRRCVMRHALCGWGLSWVPWQKASLATPRSALHLLLLSLSVGCASAKYRSQAHNFGAHSSLNHWKSFIFLSRVRRSARRWWTTCSAAGRSRRRRRWRRCEGRRCGGGGYTADGITDNFVCPRMSVCARVCCVVLYALRMRFLWSRGVGGKYYVRLRTNQRLQPPPLLPLC